jgi:two-component system OmpR family sensor kinase
MKWRSRLRLADTIFSRTLLLVLATVLLLTIGNITIIVLRGPPMNAPLTAYELARVVRGKPIAKPNQHFTRSTLDVAPRWKAESARDKLLAGVIASHLGLPASDVVVRRQPDRPWRGPMDSILDQEFQLYSPDHQFNPTIFGDFQLAVRQPDGSWLSLASSDSGAFRSWQARTAWSFLLSLLLIVPIAWIFSSRIARPIRAFGEAAERLGRRHQAGMVEMEGPIEIRRAALAINEMQQRLTSYLAERSSMVGAIAHDLRTPLSRLRFLIAPASNELRLKAEAEVAEMEALIAAILDFVQNEGRPRTEESIELSLLIEGVVDDFADLGYDVSFESTGNVAVCGDAPLLKRLFVNLISNAINYGKCARVSLRVEDGEAIADIVDEGPGLGQADLDRVFLPFFRAEGSRSRATGGMGLGLAIVKTVVETHGGSVQMINRDSGGLCARVTLPIPKASR